MTSTVSALVLTIVPALLALGLVVARRGLIVVIVAPLLLLLWAVVVVATRTAGLAGDPAGAVEGAQTALAAAAGGEAAVLKRFVRKVIRRGKKKVRGYRYLNRKKRMMKPITMAANNTQRPHVSHAPLHL